MACEQPVPGSSSSEPFDGGGEVGETAESGLDEGRDEGRDDGLWSGEHDDDLRAVRTEPDRVLVTYVAAGRVLQAVVLRHGGVEPGRGAGADGIAWYVGSSARCDVVEHPDGLAESQGAEVDSGYRHGDERLWLSADARRAYVGTTDQVDVWPRLSNGFGCA